jgi:hypothetical protein
LQSKKNNEKIMTSLIDRNGGSWTVEYHCGNSNDTVKFVRSIANYSDAIETALKFLVADDGEPEGKYGWPSSQRELARAHLFRFGYIGDGSRAYKGSLRGLTRVEVYFEPVVPFENNGVPLVETQNESDANH